MSGGTKMGTGFPASGEHKGTLDILSHHGVKVNRRDRLKGNIDTMFTHLYYTGALAAIDRR
jgi:hypothetical protein